MSREGTLLFGSLLMSLVTLVGGALFYMRPDGEMALLILLGDGLHNFVGGPEQLCFGMRSQRSHFQWVLFSGLVVAGADLFLIWSLKSSITPNQAWHFMALPALRTVCYSCSSLPSCLEKRS